MTTQNFNVQNAASELYQLREHWLTLGPPPSVIPAMSPFLRDLKKGPLRNTWRGKPTGRLSVRDRRAGGGGANFGRTFQTFSPGTGSEFAVPIRELWQQWVVTYLTLELMKNDGLIGNQDFQTELTSVAESFWIMLSILVMGDGTGRMAKGNGAWTITGPVITFLNVKCAHRFEQGDMLVFTPFDEVVVPGNMATPRAYTGSTTNQTGPVVLAVDEELGTVTTDQADLSAVITGLDFRDYISTFAHFGSANGTIDGIFRWVPFTNTEAEKDLFSVVRGNRVSRLAGKRVKVDKTMSPAQIVALLLERVPELGASSRGHTSKRTGKIIVPAKEAVSLAAELAQMNFTILDPTVAPTAMSPTTLSMGISGIRVQLGDITLTVTPDLWLCDIELPADEDKTYLVTLDDAWHIETSSSGFNWNDRGRGMLERVDGSSNDFAAPYGGTGNLYPDAVGDNLLATTRALL